MKLSMMPRELEDARAKAAVFLKKWNVAVEGSKIPRAYVTEATLRSITPMFKIYDDAFWDALLDMLRQPGTRWLGDAVTKSGGKWFNVHWLFKDAANLERFVSGAFLRQEQGFHGDDEARRGIEAREAEMTESF